MLHQNLYFNLSSTGQSNLLQSLGRTCVASVCTLSTLMSLATPSLAAMKQSNAQAPQPEAPAIDIQLDQSLTLAQNPAPLTLARNLTHGGSVNAIAFSRDGQFLASAGGDGAILVWNVNAALQGDEKRFLHRVIAIPAADKYATSLAFSPDGRWLVTGTYNGGFRSWDLNNCDPKRSICASEVLADKDYTSVAPKVQFHPQQSLLAGSNFDGTVTLWNWNGRTTRSVLEAESGAHNGTRLDGRFSSLNFTPDGRFLVAGSHDTTLSIWDLQDQQRDPLKTVKTAYGVETVAFSPDGKTLANGNLKGVELRSVRYKRGRFIVEEPVALNNGSRVNTLSFSPDGRFLFTGGNSGSVALWDVASAKPAGTIPANQQHQKAVLSVAVDSGRNLYASGSADGALKLWQLN